MDIELEDNKQFISNIPHTNPDTVRTSHPVSTYHPTISTNPFDTLFPESEGTSVDTSEIPRTGVLSEFTLFAQAQLSFMLNATIGLFGQTGLSKQCRPRPDAADLI